MKPLKLLVFGLGLSLSASLNLSAQPVPHHFTGLTVAPDRTVTLTLDGSVAGMFNLTGTISNQFRQMFDLYPVEASTDLADWTRLALLLRTNSNPVPLLFQATAFAWFFWSNQPIANVNVTLVMSLTRRGANVDT